MSIETKDNETPQVVKDMWDRILNDKWMYAVAWGQPRTGKSVLAMDLCYNVYKDWDQVLQSFVFNLAGFLYKKNKGEPCKIMTRNKLHDRVPMLIGDDWGAQANKAKTRHEPAWDLVKGAWDTYGTKIAIFLTTMNTPDEITQQLQNKYTHELYLPTRGEVKYDSVDWEQDFRGWKPRQDKEWIQTFKFPDVPLDVYKEYDEMRQSLVDELDTLIMDKMAESETERTIKRMNKDDINLLEIIQQKSLLSYDFFRKEENEHLKDALKRAKARSLVIPVRKNSNYAYELSDFGIQLLETIQLQTADPKQLKRNLQMNTP